MNKSSSDIVRVYPIRTTRKEWNIPIYCYHKCNLRCSQMYIRDEVESDTELVRYILVDNPEYVNEKCPMHSRLQRTFVRLSTFDYDNPYGGSGPLYEPDEIVIPDKVFSVVIEYPLSHPVEVSMFTGASSFSKKDLIQVLKVMYQYIYHEEENTSTIRTYHLKKQCEKCHDKNAQDYVKQPVQIDSNDKCSICYTNYDKKENVGILSCGHMYHNQCILKWLETSTTCPLGFQRFLYSKISIGVLLVDSWDIVKLLRINAKKFYT